MANQKKPTAKNNLVQIPTADLIPNPRNAKNHDDIQVAKIAGSIREFGFAAPIVTDGDNGILAGHGRWLAACKLGMATVPCVEMTHLTDTQRRAYMLADNRLAEIGGGWDMETLRVELDELTVEDVDLAAIGFGDDFIFDDADNENDLNNSDDIDPDAQDGEILVEKWGVKVGQTWKLGHHLIYCGSRENSQELAYNCDTLFFDPPWDEMSDPTNKFNSVLAFCDGKRASDVIKIFGAPTWVMVWDCVTSWYTPNRPLKRGKICLWYGDVEKYNFDGSHYGEPLASHTVSNTRGSYEFKPDPRGKHLSDVFSMPITAAHADGMNKHSKPLDWVRMLVANCTEGNIYDPYLGSGVSIIAAEQLGRTVKGSEIEPESFAIILERWSNFTNKNPVKK